MSNIWLIIGAAVFHEVGHLTCARSLKLKVRRLGMNWRGPYIVREQGNPLQNLAVSLAGPLTNLIMAGSMILAPLLGTGVIIFGLYNLILGLYNLFRSLAVTDSASQTCSSVNRNLA